MHLHGVGSIKQWICFHGEVLKHRENFTLHKFSGSITKYHRCCSHLRNPCGYYIGTIDGKKLKRCKAREAFEGMMLHKFHENQSNGSNLIREDRRMNIIP